MLIQNDYDFFFTQNSGYLLHTDVYKAESKKRVLNSH